MGGSHKKRASGAAATTTSSSTKTKGTSADDDDNDDMALLPLARAIRDKNVSDLAVALQAQLPLVGGTCRRRDTPTNCRPSFYWWSFHTHLSHGLYGAQKGRLDKKRHLVVKLVCMPLPPNDDDNNSKRHAAVLHLRQSYAIERRFYDCPAAVTCMRQAACIGHRVKYSELVPIHTKHFRLLALS